jgi:hypothetical protein
MSEEEKKCCGNCTFWKPWREAGGGDCEVYSKAVKPTGQKCANWRKAKEKKR